MPSLDSFTVRRMATRELPRNFFDMIQGPNIYQFFSQYEMDYLKHIILNNKNDVKLTMMSAIMSSKGFSRVAGGTNRIVYRFLDDPNFLVKVALDRTGLQDNLKEFQNQRILKPFVTKIFSVSRDGMMATTERCIPITRKEEFETIIDDVFYTIVSIIGEYVMEDIGKGFFRNWCIRPSFGPVLCDYPYLYRVDESKLFCNKIDLDTGIRCGGQIDYDDAFNYLVCTKCGKRYLAVELEDKSPNNRIITTRFGGKYPMKINVTLSDGTVYNSGSSSRVITKPKKDTQKPGKLKIGINGLTSEPAKIVTNPTMDRYAITSDPDSTMNQGRIRPDQPLVEFVEKETPKVIKVSDSVQIETKVEVTTIPEENKEEKPVLVEEAPEVHNQEVAVKSPEIKKSAGLKISSGFIKSGTESEY